MATRKLSNNDRVLIALAYASGNSISPVAYEEIVLESWKRFPDKFSLRNYPHFPDSADQNKSLYGNLKKRGYVVILRDRFFRLTEPGLEHALKLQGAVAEVSGAKPSGRLSREDLRLVSRAGNSEAYAKWLSNGVDEIVDFDARGFYGVSVTMPQDERQRSADALRRALAAACEIGHESASGLRDLARFLDDQFPEVVGLPRDPSRKASA